MAVTQKPVICSSAAGDEAASRLLCSGLLAVGHVPVKATRARAPGGSFI